MNCKHIVLTGASGFLGKHLLHSFLAEPLLLTGEANPHSCRFYALYNSHPNFDDAVMSHTRDHQPSNGFQIQTFSLDLTNEKAIDTWLDNELSDVPVLHVCIHLSAVSNPGQCQADPAMARAANIPKSFFNAMLDRKKCRTMIALSTDHVYPGTDPPYREDDASSSADWRPINMYGTTKHEMEEFLMDQNEGSSSARIILLRSSIMLGPKGPVASDQSKSTFLHFCASRKDIETNFWTDEKRNVISVGDVISVIRWFIANENSGSGVYNMGGPQSVSRFDMARAVFEHFGYDTKCLVAKEKGQQEAQNPSKGAPSPLDITMDSTKLALLTKLKFATLDDIIAATFSPISSVTSRDETASSLS